MSRNRFVHFSVLAALLMGAVGCKELPGNREQQGAVIGGLGGAAAGAAVGGEKHRLLGAILGAAAGAAGGYVIAAKTDHISNNDSAAAQQAANNAQQHPATAAEARAATTGDINHDGFVTMDEIVAMKDAGFSDDEMLRRLRATDQIFELTSDQQQYLRDRGVSQNVINQMLTINADKKQQILNQRGDVLGHPSTSATTTAPR
jgi:uncharacterized membrane protein YebE (DUF533 family)